jgi:hypothetical protein
MKDARQKAQEIVDEVVRHHVLMGQLTANHGLHLSNNLTNAIEQAIQEAAKVDKSRCPCGGIILADTDECKVPVCIECCVEISKSYLNMDENYNEGFKRGMDAAKVEWPERLKFIVEMGIRKFTDERSEYGEGYDMGALDAYDWLRTRVSKEG